MQSDNVFKESVSLHSEQSGMLLSQILFNSQYLYCIHCQMTILPMYPSFSEVEAEVVDKLKYIEETKETMDENTKKLAEIVQDIRTQTGRK